MLKRHLTGCLFYYETPFLCFNVNIDIFAKVKACKNSDELLALAKAEGIELSEEQLTAVNGGCHTSTVEQNSIDQMQCPLCLNWYCMEKVSEYWHKCKWCQKITINTNPDK